MYMEKLLNSFMSTSTRRGVGVVGDRISCAKILVQDEVQPTLQSYFQQTPNTAGKIISNFQNIT